MLKRFVMVFALFSATCHVFRIESSTSEKVIKERNRSHHCAKANADNVSVPEHVEECS